jgi:type II secretory pathway component PulF
VIEFNLARFSRAMSALLRSGVPIDQALELTSSVTGNSRYQKSILAAVGFVQKGIPMTEVLKGYPKLYPPIASRMIEVGERTGRMDHMLGRLAAFYEKSVTNTLGNISSVIEPLLLLSIGLAVGFVAVAILTPIWKFSQAI